MSTAAIGSARQTRRTLASGSGDVPPPLCPRCGYDLRGQIATWKDACPLSGRCNECGLEFEWSQVFVVAEHPWLFEYHWKRKPIRSALATLLRSLFPWRFWRDVGLFDEARLRPAFLLVAALAAPAVLIIYGLRCWDTWNAYPLWVRWGGVPAGLSGVERCLWTFQEAAQYAFFEFYSFAPLALAFLWVVVYFAVIFLLPASLRRARVRPSHIARIGIYSAIVPFASSMIAVFLPEPFETLNHVLRPILSVVDEALFDSVWRPILRSGINKAEAEEMTLAMLWPFWLAPFWGFACERYLRLPRPWLVTIILSILSALIVTSVLLMATAAL